MIRKALLLTVCMLAITYSSFAQKFTPLETWPYVYEDFTPGIINTRGDQVMSYDLLNINIADGKVHYVADGVIMQADMANVNVVKIKNEYYINCSGKMYKVLLETEHGAVVSISVIDEDEMKKANLGYGRSAVASTYNVSLFAVEGGDTSKRSLDDMMGDRYSGAELILKDKMYLLVDGILIRAAKQDVLTYAGDKKDEVKSFIKTKKLKFRNIVHLSMLVEYLYGLKAAE